MEDSNGTSTRGGSGGSSSSKGVTKGQLEEVLSLIQLEFKNLSYDTLDANQKLNLLTIRTLGTVYGVVAAFHLCLVILRPEFTFSQASQTLQSVLILFAALYGLVMLLFKIIEIGHEFQSESG